MIIAMIVTNHVVVLVCSVLSHVTNLVVVFVSIAISVSPFLS